jgi:hypothetical protein
MKYFFPMIGLLMAAITGAQARVGESMEQCRARYGILGTETLQKQCSASDTAMLFLVKTKEATPKNITVHLEFRQGRVWFIRYLAKAFSSEELDTLLDGCSDGLEWRAPLAVGARKFWLNANKTRVAQHYRIGSRQVLDILSDACVEALESQRAQEAAYAAQLASKASNEAEAGAGNPSPKGVAPEVDPKEKAKSILEGL